jgi:hypothetical protein
MPYCTLEEAWNVEVYPDDEKDVVTQSPPPEKYGYSNKIYENNPTPMDIPKPRYMMKEHLSEFEMKDLNIPTSSTPNNQYLQLIDELKKENKSLKDKISQLQKYSDKDSLFDVILYISTGIFVIFMMENISTMGRRF